jgi:sugar phosphate isomerase/epimerase
MHPLWACGERLGDFLAPLGAAGLAGLEFELWPNDPKWSCFPQLIADCKKLGFALSFHAPYRGPYTIAGFADQAQAEIEAAYTAMFNLAAEFAPAVAVVHGASSGIQSYEELRADTIAFLRWALARYPSLTFALENVNPDPQLTKVGTERSEVLEIVQAIGNPPLGICWDMGHDILADHREVPSATWLRHVIHAHVHDINEQRVDHCPLIYGQVPYDTWLPQLVKAGFHGAVVLELKGSNLPNRSAEAHRHILTESIAKIAQSLKHRSDCAKILPRV